MVDIPSDVDEQALAIARKIAGTHGIADSVMISRLQLAAIEGIMQVTQQLKQEVIDVVSTAKLPQQNWSAGFDHSGVTLTLQRQRTHTARAIKEHFATKETS